MTGGKSAVRLVRCDECARAFAPSVRVVWDGDREIANFRCPFCGRGYLVSVSDTDLRANVARYKILAGEVRRKGGEYSAETHRKLRDLHAENVRRSRELKENYRKELTQQ